MAPSSAPAGASYTPTASVTASTPLDADDSHLHGYVQLRVGHWYATFGHLHGRRKPADVAHAHAQRAITFAGWFTSSTGGTLVGAGGASYTPTASVTLYAQWTANLGTSSLELLPENLFP